uniref:Semaphorin-1A n=1 Tax=Ascaris lumbricoides TaxID=6252 RepID=A0A0M3IFJ2_ASCLU
MRSSIHLFHAKQDDGRLRLRRSPGYLETENRHCLMRADSEFSTEDCFSCAVDNSAAMLVTSLLDSKPFEIFSDQRDIKVNWPKLKRARPLAPFLLPNESAPTS